MSEYLARVSDLRNDPYFPCSLPRALWGALFNARDYRVPMPGGAYIITVAYVSPAGVESSLNSTVLNFNPDAANDIGRALEYLKCHKYREVK